MYGSQWGSLAGACSLLKKNSIFFTTSYTRIRTSNAPFYTVDRENFAVKIISQLRPTVKIKHAKIKLRGDDQ